MAAVTYPCYIQRRDNQRQWYWIFYASNGKAIARSSESYIAKSDCEHSIGLTKTSSGAPIFTQE